jgi:ATP-dependent protease HslVU (ClpYQ) peptidase subunit
MTTIACDKTSMACDSLTDHGNIRLLTDSKIVRVRNELIGMAGLKEGSLLFVEWYKGDRKQRPQIKIDFSVIVLNEKGIFLYQEYFVCIKVRHDFYALGSGAEAALGAMHAGASPKEAVEIACKVNMNTGLPVRVYNLST